MPEFRKGKREMNDEQKVAYVYAQAVCAQIELQAMLAENQSRATRGLAQAWGRRTASWAAR